MRWLRRCVVGSIGVLGFVAQVLGATLVVAPSKESVPLRGTRAFTASVDGSPAAVKWSVNNVVGGNAIYGIIGTDGVYTAPAAVPSKNPVTIGATTIAAPVVTGYASVSIRLPTPLITSVAPTTIPIGAYTLTVNGSNFYSGAQVWINSAALSTTWVSTAQLKVTGNATVAGTLSLEVVNPGGVHSAVNSSVTVTGSGTPPLPPPASDPATIAAARFLEQATFGATPADIAAVKQVGASAWLTQQLALPASPLPATSDLNVLRKGWYTNMASGPDQVRQRMIFALSQIFVVSADKNPYGNEMLPWLTTISNNALGNFGTLLAEMTLNPSMAKYLDLGNSIIPSPNENYAREVMQLFTIGLYMLNQDGTLQADGNGNPIPTYTQAQMHDVARALSGWTYPGPSATGTNWESFTGPLQPRDAYHDKGAKTLLLGVNLPAGQTAVQDYNAVMQNIFTHPNVAPFIATRLIRALVTSNPSPAYVNRVADVFANNGAGVRGDLAATARAVLLDPEARADTPTATQGHLKDPILQSLGLIRTLSGTVIDPSNLFWDYFLMSEKLLNAPSVFNFYSPMTKLPGSPQYVGPEFQIYAASLAISRANFLYALISGGYGSMIAINITPFVTAASNSANLINLVDATLLQGRMSTVARTAIASALAASTDARQNAITALYLAAITAEFGVLK